MKTLALMTSGGDAPGMNAAIRSVTRIALGHRFRVLGFKRGYEGILQEQFQEMDARSVSNVVQRGGTILKTARSAEFRTLEGTKKAALNLQKLGVDSLVLIGGDGTFRGAMELAKVWKGQLIGIPGTIDNDLFGTDFTLGFDRIPTAYGHGYQPFGSHNPNSIRCKPPDSFNVLPAPSRPS